MWSARPLSIPAGLFAQWRFDLELTIYGILLLVLIIAGCVAVVRVRRWRDEEVASTSLEDQIKNYYALVERGELDPKEFERIKAQLESKETEPPTPPDTRIQALPERETGIRGQASGVRKQETGIKSQESGVKDQQSDIGDDATP
jgi:hypothetical protein